MSDEVVSEAARREDTLRQVLRVIGYPLNLRRVELTHSVVGVRGFVLWHQEFRVRLRSRVGMSTLLGAPGVLGVTGLAKVAHTVGVARIHVCRVDHARLKVFNALNAVI